MARSACFVMLALVGACVFPADDATGLELSWRFAEVDESDGADTGRLRSCAGALVDRLLFTIQDDDDPTRSGTFDYPCEDGFQTPAEFSTEASDAFIDLRPGDYAITIDAIGVLESQLLRSFDVDVLSRSPTAQALNLAFEPVTWVLSIAGTGACTEASFALHYLDAEVDLAEPVVDDDGNPVDVLYRAQLASDDGRLTIGGAGTGCAELAGDHTVTRIDQGRYRIQVTVDGVACSDHLEVALLSTGANTVIDLANLDCGG